MKLTWARIKDYVYIATILLSIGYHFIDKAKEKTKAEVILEVTLKEMQKDVSEIKSTQQIKFNQYDIYWNETTESMAVISHILGVAP